MFVRIEKDKLGRGLQRNIGDQAIARRDGTSAGKPTLERPTAKDVVKGGGIDKTFRNFYKSDARRMVGIDLCPEVGYELGLIPTCLDVLELLQAGEAIIKVRI